MTSSMEPKSGTVKNLTSEDVRAYLVEHPEFWANNPSMIESVKASGAPIDAEGLPDFQSYRMAKLQDDHVDLKSEHEDLLDLMQDNIQRQNIVYAAVQSLMDAPSFESIIRMVSHDLASLLEQESIGFFLEAGGWLETGDYDGLKVIEPGKVNRWMNGGAIVLEEVQHGLHEIYGEKTSKNVRSQALIRLQIREGLPPGMLALGHADPMYYATGLATESVECLGGVVERCLSKWL